ncbi:uncharacterized protein LOC124887102 [Capsicum annuum]|uniref:uncharacterized protein LOC124887102 n=1 Tax=Capsicum annuum TaxID=4072 RepID=UPI001FB141DF|nr:uncharacterized protein LOC124887102 [Capsicum annuum]
MGSIPVLIKHTGSMNNIEQQYEDYISDAILLSINTSYNQLREVLALHMDVDLTCKSIQIEYQLTDIEEKNSFNEFVSSSICNAASMNLSITVDNVVNTSTERALIVTNSDECLDVLDIDATKVIISDPHHKHIEVEQVYILKRVLKSVMEDYTIREKFQSRSVRSSKTCYTSIYKSRNYDFLFRASDINKSGIFCVREFLSEHTCPIKDKIYPKFHATSKLIGGIVKQKFKNHKIKYSAIEIRSDMKEDISMDLTYIMCWRAKEQALEDLRVKPLASYGKLPTYIHVLNTTYLGSHIRMKKHEDNEFLPVIVVDVSYLRGLYIGTFVAACTMDGAGHIFSLAYEIVDSENDASWTWFFQNLKEAYGEREHMCVVFDRNPSIIKVVAGVYNNVPYYACMWNLWGNVKKNFRKSYDALSEIFYTMAKSYSKSEFHNLMEKVEVVDVRVKNYLELAGYYKWARSYATFHRGWTLTSYIAKSINVALVSARELPIYDFLEEFRLMFGIWNCENRQEALYTRTDLIEKFQAILQQNEAECTRMKVIPASDKNLEKGPYCFNLYKPKTILRTYDLSVYPLPHKDDWVIPQKILDKVVLPPKYKRPPERPAKKERGKSGKDMFGKKSKNYCSSCGQKRHNRRSCRKYNK